MIAHPQPTGWLLPQTPTPVDTKYAKQYPNKPINIRDGMNKYHQSAGWRFSTIPQILLVIQLIERPFVTKGSLARTGLEGSDVMGSAIICYELMKLFTYCSDLFSARHFEVWVFYPS